MKQISDRLVAWQDSRFVSIIHFGIFAVNRFFGERMNNAAASLTYSTLLALVPLIVIAFAILSSFPAFDAVQDRMREAVFGAVVPEAGAAISDYLSEFSRSATNLTAAGVVALAVTALMLLSTIEDTLNRIWHVDRPRPFLVRFLVFWAILTMGPLIFGASFTLTSDAVAFAGRLSSSEIGRMAALNSQIVGLLVSVLISIAAFTALFVLVPARRVQVKHALVGATFAAVASELLSWGFNAFLTSGSSYQTIYGAVAVVPLFLVWIYSSWMVIVLGAVIAAAIPDWSSSQSTVLDMHLKPAHRLAIALMLLGKLHRQAQEGGPIDEADLTEVAPLTARDEIVDQLHAAGYLFKSEDNRVALARDLHTTSVLDLVDNLELALGTLSNSESDLPGDFRERLAFETSALKDLLSRLFKAEEQILQQPIADLIEAGYRERGVSMPA